jgi:hypothetical protein
MVSLPTPYSTAYLHMHLPLRHCVSGETTPHDRQAPGTPLPPSPPAEWLPSPSRMESKRAALGRNGELRASTQARRRNRTPRPSREGEGEEGREGEGRDEKGEEHERNVASSLGCFPKREASRALRCEDRPKKAREAAKRVEWGGSFVMEVREEVSDVCLLEFVRWECR